jgi:hypothetical protein
MAVCAALGYLERLVKNYWPGVQRNVRPGLPVPTDRCGPAELLSTFRLWPDTSSCVAILSVIVSEGAKHRGTTGSAGAHS